MTDAFRRTRIVSHPAVLRQVRVATVRELGPHAVQVVLTGAELGPFTRHGRTWPGFTSPGPEDHIKLVLPATAGAPVVLPEVHDDKLIWPTDPEPTRRDVSVRRFDPEAGTLTIEVVRHTGGGPLAAWADRVAASDRIHLTGPRSSRLMPEAEHFVLVGDITALAAIARWSEDAPPGSSVTALVAVPEAADRRPVRRHGDGPIQVQWFHAPPEQVLVDALARVELGPDPFVFVGAENEVARAARGLLRDRRGLSARRFRCIGYWRAD